MSSDWGTAQHVPPLAFGVPTIQPKGCLLCFVFFKLKKNSPNILKIRDEQPECPSVGDRFSGEQLLRALECRAVAGKNEEALHALIGKLPGDT